MPKKNQLRRGYTPSAVGETHGFCRPPKAVPEVSSTINNRWFSAGTFSYDCGGNRKCPVTFHVIDVSTSSSDGAGPMLWITSG